jgi:hypothetical protein
MVGKEDAAEVQEVEDTSPEVVHGFGATAVAIATKPETIPQAHHPATTE